MDKEATAQFVRDSFGFLAYVFYFYFGRRWVPGRPQRMIHISNVVRSRAKAPSTPLFRRPRGFPQVIVVQYGDSCPGYIAVRPDVWYWPRFIPWVWVAIHFVENGEVCALGVGREPADFFACSLGPCSLQFLGEYRRHGSLYVPVEGTTNPYPEKIDVEL